MKMEIVSITPSMAASLLKMNKANRPLRRRRVDALKAAFSRGEYVMSHQGIAISEDEVLLDGQHRLTAIAEMPEDFAADMVVFLNVNPASFMVMDIGNRRSFSDVLKEDKRLVECARFLAALFNSNDITPASLEPFVEFARPWHDALLDFCPKNCKYFGAAAFRSAAVLLMAAGSDADHVKAAYRSMCCADFAQMPTVCQVLYRAYLNGTLSTSGLDPFARAIRVLDPENAHLKMVKVPDPVVYSARARDFMRTAIDVQKKAATKPAAAKSVKRADYRFSVA